ncbi:MAG: carboxypeptidase-like regulatory domain-containing protein [Chitinophagales bacterium]|nr:carboxypeptidase-like regulatory domain-containing protein [Chitinophagales bacterium]
MLLLCILMPTSGFGQAVIKGKVCDANTKEVLSFVQIINQDSSKYIQTDMDGNFQWTISPGDSVLNFMFIGYSNYILPLAQMNVLDSILIEMEADGLLEEVVVTDKMIQKTTRSNETGLISISKATLDLLPQMLGEKDVLRSLQLLPGVQGGTDGTRGIFVRGGSPDQNLILFDGAPVYNASHLYGFLSVFNSDALENVVLHKNYISPKYGGRLASVIDIEPDFGNNKALKGDYSIGFLTSRFHLEGPLFQPKTTFNLNLRGCYTGLFLKPLSQKSFEKDTRSGYVSYYFGDVNVGIKHNFSDKTALSYSFFYNSDIFKYAFGEIYGEDTAYHQDISETNNINWSNLASVVSLTSTIGKKWSSTQRFIFSKYFLNSERGKYRVDFQKELSTYNSQNIVSNKSHIRDLSVTSDWVYQINSRHNVDMGLNFSQTNVLTGEGKRAFEATGKNFDERRYGNPINKTYNFYPYLAYHFVARKIWEMDIGAQAAFYHIDSVWYKSIQPRVSSLLKLPKNLIIRSSFQMLQQNLHLLVSESDGITNDFWVPANANFLPEMNWQANLGIQQNFKKGYEWSIDAYYRQMNHLVEYKKGVNEIQYDEDWQQQIIGNGTGWSYGVEFYAAKTKGALTAWAKYNLNWSFRHFQELNQGENFPFKYDRRHDVSIAVQYRINDKWDISTSWTFGNGFLITIPLQQYASDYTIYLYDYYDQPWGENYLENVPNSYNTDNASRYNYRLQNYQHLDIGANCKRVAKRVTHLYNISIYNVYNNFNTFSVYKAQEKVNGVNRIVYKQLTVFPILPSFSYTVSF